ncbi:hypothetical protein F8388_005321 [Cannabis sativa]|uniref:Reverse transcriptase zinc-binding domain-containing protein n=1 Tax=Cannabis sativa TaxID=3483 RepID=A0A7J6EL75_CANSA|nr:hypothetical protein F8388_005321 [Cannabis sativa]
MRNLPNLHTQLKRRIISDVLNDRDKELVWRIPLTAAGREADWYWLKDGKGLFLVKSAYKLQHENNGHINLNVPTDLWKKLWNIKVPPKVLSFLWRVSANYLPTRFLLSSKHVQVDTLCPFCSAAPKTALHVLSEVESIEAAMTLWAVWKMRNEVVWNSISPSSEELM